MNAGHFEKGIFIPDCNRCGECCNYEYRKINRYTDLKEEGYLDFDVMHGWEIINEFLMRKYAPCKNFDFSNNSCKINDTKPDPCKRFGRGDYHHPQKCVFFGGDFDSKWGKL